MAALVLFLLLLAAEFCLRGYHILTFRQRLPSELRAETRALSWEDIENKYRIVCFGDSNTFGEDLPYAQTYPALLQELLQERYPDLNAVVINSGMRGHTSVQGLERLERDVLWYRPHVVVSAFGLNDGNLGHWPLDPLREQRMYREQSPWGRVNSLLERSHLYLTLRARLRRLQRRLGWETRPRALEVGGDVQPRVSSAGFAMAQEQLLKRIRAKGGTTAFVMTTTPVTDAFRSDLARAQRKRQLSIYDAYNETIREVAAKQGAHLVDLHTIFSNHAHTELNSLLADDGVHLTAAGARLVALSMMQGLEESGLPGSEPYRRR